MQGAVEFKFNRLSATTALLLLLFVCPLRYGCAAFTSHGATCPAVWGCQHRSRNLLPVTDQRVQIRNNYPTRKFWYRSAATSVTNELFSVVENDANVLDQAATVRNLTEEAIMFRGDTRGREALLHLGKLSDQRLPFDFDSTQGRGQTQASGSLISHFPAMLPRDVAEKVLEKVKALEREGCFGTNPDSVDGLPSFHLNLVSNGQALVASLGGEDEDKDDLDDFKLGLQDLLGIVNPYVYDELLPEVNQMMKSSSIRVADIFLRRYGQDLTMMDGNSSRNGITAHYDVFSRVTCVIALDDVAAQGTQGLFTTQVDDDGKTSNHAALRRFFPLACGDGVVHTWDVLHGVDVEPGLDRTSLVIWFTTEEELDPNQSLPPAPWLYEQPDLETNDVGQFVLASAIASSDESFRDDSSWGSESNSKTMSQSSSMPDDHEHDHNDSRRSTTATHHPFDLYLDSASRENTFALTRLGSLCEDGMLDEEMTSRAEDLVCRLRPDLPKVLHQREDDDVPASMSSMYLAKRFWFEGAVRGNPLAQIAWGDEILFEASESGEADALILAAVLFGLAAQQGQGNEQAMKSLKRVLEFDATFGAYETQDDFLRSPVVQAAEAACRLLLPLPI
jgi:hypothetical protein